MLFDKSPWNVFDTYNPFIKQLAENYNFMQHGYQWYITQINPNSIINKLMDKWLRLKNGAIYFLKSGTNQIQKVTKENAGLAAVTFLTRKFKDDTINISDEELKKYKIVNKFF